VLSVYLALSFVQKTVENLEGVRTRWAAKLAARAAPPPLSVAKRRRFLLLTHSASLVVGAAEQIATEVRHACAGDDANQIEVVNIETCACRQMAVVSNCQHGRTACDCLVAAEVWVMTADAFTARAVDADVLGADMLDRSRLCDACRRGFRDSRIGPNGGASFEFVVVDEGHHVFSHQAHAHLCGQHLLAGDGAFRDVFSRVLGPNYCPTVVFYDPDQARTDSAERLFPRVSTAGVDEALEHGIGGRVAPLEVVRNPPSVRDASVPFSKSLLSKNGEVRYHVHLAETEGDAKCNADAVELIEVDKPEWLHRHFKSVEEMVKKWAGEISLGKKRLNGAQTLFPVGAVARDGDAVAWDPPAGSRASQSMQLALAAGNAVRREKSNEQTSMCVTPSHPCVYQSMRECEHCLHVRCPPVALVRVSASLQAVGTSCQHERVCFFSCVVHIVLSHCCSRVPLPLNVTFTLALGH
jgi:hypothetical protein